METETCLPNTVIVATTSPSDTRANPLAIRLAADFLHGRTVITTPEKPACRFWQNPKSASQPGFWISDVSKFDTCTIAAEPRRLDSIGSKTLSGFMA
jgi:hypothetical protein